MRKLRDLLKYLALVYLIVEWRVIFPSLIHLLLVERESKGMRMNILIGPIKLLYWSNWNFQSHWYCIGGIWNTLNDVKYSNIWKYLSPIKLHLSPRSGSEGEKICSQTNVNNVCLKAFYYFPKNKQDHQSFRKSS